MVAMDRTTGIQRLGAALLALRWMCEQHSPQGGRHGRSEIHRRTATDLSFNRRSGTAQGLRSGPDGFATRPGRCRCLYRKRQPERHGSHQRDALERSITSDGLPWACRFIGPDMVGGTAGALSPAQMNCPLGSWIRPSVGIDNACRPASLRASAFHCANALIRRWIARRRFRALISGALHWHDPVSVRVVVGTTDQCLKVSRHQHEAQLQRPKVIDLTFRPLIYSRRRYSESARKRGGIAVVCGNGFFLGDPGHVHATHISTLPLHMQAHLLNGLISSLT